MLRAVSLFFFVIGLSAFAAPIWAQQPGDYGLSDRIHWRVIGIEKDYESMVRSVAPDFRLVREVEDFPPLRGSIITIAIEVADKDRARMDRLNSPPVIAALHDRLTGAALASCRVPCAMKGMKTPPTVVTIYRYGSKPESYNSERFSTYEPPAKLYLGFNEVEYQIIRDECAAAFTEILEAHFNRDAKPCYRLPPLMPSEALRSGHCKTVFDVSEYGEPINVVIESCTDTIFCAASLDSLSNWIYHPAIENGMPLTRFGVESKVTYRLANEGGQLIPEPETLRWKSALAASNSAYFHR
jgi:hypothetical protein